MRYQKDLVLFHLASAAPPPNGPWVHIFSKSCANSSLHTQCAAVAAVDVKSPTDYHRHLCWARKKCGKIEQLLQEIAVPLTQVKLSNNDIDPIIIVSNGGNEGTPPIRPPEGIRWHSIPIRHLYVEDKLMGDIVLHCLVVTTNVS